MVYEVLNVIVPTFNPVRSFVIVVFAAPAGNTKGSDAAGVPAGDQFEGFDQLPLADPFQERMTANPGKQTKKQITSDTSAARLWTMNGTPRPARPPIFSCIRKDRTWIVPAERKRRL
jgi:hypothetical protein